MRGRTVWKDIPGYEGLYRVSNKGDIFGVKRGRVKDLSLNGGGYRYTSLSKKGVVSTYSVHTLVALAFIGERPEGLEVRHLNCVRGDNRANNLAYGTSFLNRMDSVRAGNARGVPLSEAQKDRLESLLLEGGRLQSDIAKEFNISASSVNYYKRRVARKAKAHKI